MANLEVVTMNGGPAGSVEVKDSLVSSEIKLDAVRQCVDAYLSNQRQGTSMTKTRGLVSGGGVKPWRQKGTGRARAGSIRSPLWVGGGTIFGPSPRSYHKKVNKKVRQAAFRSILTDKVGAKRLTVLDSLAVEGGRVKTLLDILSSLRIAGKTLIVTEAVEPNVVRAARNVPGVGVQVVESMNVYEMLNHDNLVVTKAAIKRMEEMWA